MLTTNKDTPSLLSLRLFDYLQLLQPFLPQFLKIVIETHNTVTKIHNNSYQNNEIWNLTGSQY